MPSVVVPLRRLACMLCGYRTGSAVAFYEHKCSESRADTARAGRPATHPAYTHPAGRPA